jgi:transketolase
MFKVSTEELKEKAYRIRRDLIELHFKAGSGHLDTSLSLVEIWLALAYSDFFQFNPKDGAWTGRDRIFLSEGHACPLQYLVNANLGYTTRDAVFAGFRRPFTQFQGHTQRDLKCGLENSNGSLGNGIWQAYGQALVTDRNVFCIAGDGEFEEPSSLGLLFAPHLVKPAPNFTLIINSNRLAQDDVVNLGPVDKVAEIYDWQVQRVNGHDFDALGNAYHQAVADTKRPSLIICDTIKGKGGDPALLGKLGYHGRPPKNEKEYQAHLAGLEASRRS